MPSGSEKQRRLMAMALAIKKGEEKSKSPLPNKLARRISLAKLREFARSVRDEKHGRLK